MCGDEEQLNLLEQGQEFEESRIYPTIGNYYYYDYFGIPKLTIISPHHKTCYECAALIFNVTRPSYPNFSLSFKT